MCIGKRFAELKLQLLCYELLRRFKIEWAGDQQSMGTKIRITNVPSMELKFKFIPL